MKRKIKWLLLFSFLLLFVGWGKKNVELLNAKKLIDLNAALGNCVLGADAILPDDKENTEQTQISVTPTVTPKLQSTPRPTATPRPLVALTPQPTATPTPRTIVISVRDRKVMYDTLDWESVDTLKAQIQKDHAAHISFRLVDDFAEAHVYREIMAILAELEAETGIRYTKD